MIEVKGFVAPVATPGVTVSESAIAVTEGGATDTYTVVLDTAPTGDVTIAVTETSADITVSATTLTFGTANWSAAQTVTVTAVDDSTTESEETVTITHSVSATADTTDYPTTLTVDSVSVTVTDNDATPPGAPVLTAAAKNESIELTWTIADHGTSDITRFDYRIKQTTGGTYPATWTDTGAAALNTGGSATIGSLTNGTQYTVQVRGVNSDGEGAGSNEPTATPDAPPAITSVAITSDPGTDKTYIIGEEIEFTLTFDKDLTLGGTDTSKSNRDTSSIKRTTRRTPQTTWTARRPTAQSAPTRRRPCAQTQSKGLSTTPTGSPSLQTPWRIRGSSHISPDRSGSG